MKELKTEIIINSPAETVWEVLTDFKLYPEWNSFIRKIHLSPETPNRLSLSIQLPGKKEMSFKPQLLKLEKNRELRWKGKLLMKGLFDGEHYFILERIDKKTTAFIHGEKFTGILIPFLPSVLASTKTGFEKMNLDLKKRCEATNGI